MKTEIKKRANQGTKVIGSLGIIVERKNETKNVKKKSEGQHGSANPNLQEWNLDVEWSSYF